MNHLATPVAPSERIRGATSESDTSPPQCRHPEGEGAWNQVGWGPVVKHVQIEQATYLS